MKKYIFAGMAAVVLMISTMGICTPEAGAEGFNKDVELTIEQKDEMAKLQQKALEQKVEIIHKYVEYGVITEEKGEKIISRLEKHHKELADNGFIPKWDKHKRHGNHHD
ncbi:ribosomal protein S20 [Evansella vedderi]|uniref:Ribosomal protein S20 n=1 Tax=Evansella vedderi TaxID=38282 RepID=A0ABT9ZQH1_9BACI|nr:YckD family protein [Evansella vedderi]MDQ0253491.1 ribosomal protein S20 [Evansella vedderi]